jgi:hypothetical protein
MLAKLLLLPLLVFSTPQGGKYLVKDPIVVEPQHYVFIRFTVPEGGARVVGRFRASGGSGNDIEVYILDEDAFENFRNGHRASTYYNSGRVTVGKINVHLEEEGTYYLVFSNTFSLFSNKVVNARVFIEEEP